jgi:hypothetical protein
MDESSRRIGFPSLKVRALSYPFRVLFCLFGCYSFFVQPLGVPILTVSCSLHLLDVPIYVDSVQLTPFKAEQKPFLDVQLQGLRGVVKVDSDEAVDVVFRVRGCQIAFPRYTIPTIFRLSWYLSADHRSPCGEKAVSELLFMLWFF